METEYDRIKYYEIDEKRRKEIIERVASFLSRFRRIKLAYIFGGFTRRDFVRDIDVAVYAVKPLNLKELLKLGGELEAELRIPVDLVPLEELSPAFRFKILSEGIPVLIRDKVLHHSLLCQAFSEMQDLKISFRLAGHPTP